MSFNHNNNAGAEARYIYVNYVDGGGDNHMGQADGVSSVSDHGTGDFSFGITNAYSSVNHYVQTCIQEGASHGHGGTRNTGRHSASVIAVETFNSSGSLVSIASNILTAGDLA